MATPTTLISIQKGYDGWLKEWHNHPDRAPFFLTYDQHKGIEEGLRKNFEDIVSTFLGPGMGAPRTGRIIVHGYLPRFPWSRTVVYRTVDMFFGGLHPACIRHLTDLLYEADQMRIADLASPNTQAPEALLSRHLRTEISDQLGWRSFVSPPCWPASFRCMPKVWQCEREEMRCPQEKFGLWSASDVFTLSRLRFRRWSLMRNELIRTASNQELIRTASNQEYDGLGLCTEDYVRQMEGESADVCRDIVSDARRWHRIVNRAAVLAAMSEDEADLSKKLCSLYGDEPDKSNSYRALRRDLRNYSSAFRSDVWEQALVWNEEALACTDGELTKSEYGDRDGNVSPARLSWVSTDWLRAWKDRSASRTLRMDAERCAFFGDKPPSGDLFYGIYNVPCRTGRISVYVEFLGNHDAVAKLKELSLYLGTQEQKYAMVVARSEGAAWDRLDGNRKEDLKTKERALLDYAGSVLPMWHDYIRSADEVLENHEAFSALYPEGAHRELVSENEQSEKDFDDSAKETAKDFLGRTRSVKLFYQHRVRNEEGSPLDIALTAMRDMWSFAFEDMVEPHYTEFQRFQHLLKGISEYRDHLTHSVQVFLLGNRILDFAFGRRDASGTVGIRDALQELADRLWRICPSNPLSMSIYEDLDESEPRRLTDVTYSDAFLKLCGERAERVARFQWTLASLMHDFAVPAERTNEILNHLFDTFLGVSVKSKDGSNGLKSALSDRDAAYRAFVHGLLLRTKTGSATRSTLLPLVGDLAYNRLAEDHGFLSAVYLFNQLFEQAQTRGQKWWSLKEKVRKKIGELVFDFTADNTEPGRKFDNLAEGLVLEVLDAIAKHNIFFKDRRLLMVETPAFKLPGEFFSASGSVFGGPIAGLMLLCDLISDWGRVVHPDELSHHEMGSRPTTGVKQSEISRPDGQITRIHENLDGLMQIDVDYRWRLPVQPVMGGNEPEWCLRSLYRRLRKDMFPFAPGFTIWEGCRACGVGSGNCPAKPTEINCRAFGVLKRFWTAQITSPDDGEQTVPWRNLLKFPGKWSPFNKIELHLTFCGEELCKPIRLSE